MDNWAEFGPFGKNEDNRLKGYSAFANGKVYHNFIISLLFSPGVTIKRLGSTNNFTISIHIPLYGDFDTDAYLDVEVVEHIRVGNTITPKSYNVPINHNVIDKNMRHKIAEPVEYRNQKGIVERFDYQAFFDLDTVSTSISFLKSASTEVVSIHAKASIMKNNITYPQDVKAYRDKKASDDDVKTKDDIINKAAEKKDWAKDIYRTGLVYRIGEIFD